MANIPLGDVLASLPVTKSNELIVAGFDEMTSKEFQLFALAVAKIPPNAALEDNPVLKICVPWHEMNEVFGIEKYSESQLIALGKKLTTRQIVIKNRVSESVLPDLFDARVSNPQDQKKKWGIYTLVPSCVYIGSSFVLTMNPDLNEHFIGLRDHVTTYSLSELKELKSFKVSRLYENLRMLKASYSQDEFLVSMEHLRSIMGLQNKYPRFVDFKSKVLDPAIEAISTKTSLTVSYDQVVKGRATVAIKFYIENKVSGLVDAVKKTQPVLTGLTDPNRDDDERLVFARIMLDYGFTEEAAHALAMKFEGNPEEMHVAIERGLSYLKRQESLQNREIPDNEVMKIMSSALSKKWTPNFKGSVFKIKPASTKNTTPPLPSPASPAKETVDVNVIRQKLNSDARQMELFNLFIKRNYVAQEFLMKEGFDSRKLDQFIIEFVTR